MKLFEFEKFFPDEESCMKKFKEMRDKEGVVCPKCGSKEHIWLSGHKQYQCRHCRNRIGLRSGTVMHASKLPFRYWFIAMHLLTATKRTFSASELQRQLGHKRYQPVWEMLHKLRSVMGKRDGRYMLGGDIEIDEGFFTAEIPDEHKGEKLKAGVGSQRKAKVLVMAESAGVADPKKIGKPKRVGHIKMVVIPDTLASTIDNTASRSITRESRIMSDACSSHAHLKNIFTEHKSQVVNPKDLYKVLPWVYIAIANAKTLLADIYHGIKPEFLQEYLNEYCYRFNRRYFGEDLFERILLAGASCRADFEHRAYRRKGAA